jgi:hypothetical protein
MDRISGGVHFLDCRHLPIAALGPAGHLKTGEVVICGQAIKYRFTLDSRRPFCVLSIELDGRPANQLVYLESTRQAHRGRRLWFVCGGPDGQGCDRRAAKLYQLPGSMRFICRRCAGVLYG